MNLDQLTAARPDFDGRVADTLGSLSTDDLRDLIDSMSDSVDLDAVAEHLSDAATHAADALSGVAVATGSLSARGGRAAWSGARRVGRTAVHRPVLTVGSIAAVAALVALFLWWRRDERGVTDASAAELQVAA